MQKAVWHEKARSMASQGHSSREIAETVGMSIRQVQIVIKGVEGRHDHYRERTKKALERPRPKFVSRAKSPEAKLESEQRRAERDKARALSGRAFLLKHSEKPEHKPTKKEERIARIARLLAVDGCSRKRPPITLPRLSILEDAL